MAKRIKKKDAICKNEFVFLVLHDKIESSEKRKDQYVFAYWSFRRYRILMKLPAADSSMK